jgi:DNA (cytosine-5)-methyltransferase 1
MHEYDADDLFEGAGGWAEGARSLGLTTRGYEIWAPAVATARAAGHHVVEGDVRAYDPAQAYGRGLIASPPCQTFSTAGKGAGRAALDRLREALRTGWWFPQDGDDERTTLVLEPYRWIATRLAVGRPYEWLAFEQVAPVLPIWEVYAEWLRGLGYGVATGVLSAEQYGVPQTRKRAVLVARLGEPAALPVPTHSRYYSRTPDRLDEGVLPWVSMAEALGWGMTALYGERDAERWLQQSNYSAGGTGTAAERGLGERELLEPSFALTGKGFRWAYRSNALPNSAVRPLDAPAPTVMFGRAVNDVSWVVSTGVNSATVGPGPARDALMAEGRWREAHKPQERPIDRPAPTVDGKVGGAWAVHWPGERPATTVNGDPRISPPGRDDPAVSGSQQRGAIRVSLEEAATLQTFPSGYPWRGNKGETFQQVGNAVPPLLARAVLAVTA